MLIQNIQCSVNPCFRLISIHIQINRNVTGGGKITSFLNKSNLIDKSKYMELKNIFLGCFKDFGAPCLQTYTYTHRLITTQIDRFRGFLFTITLRQKPKGVPRKQRWIERHRESVYFGLLPQGYCERKTPTSWKDDI